MKLIKVFNDGETRYFSSVQRASEWLNVYPNAVRNAKIYKKTVKGYNVEESNDNVWSNEIDKNI